VSNKIWYVGLPNDDHPVSSRLGRYFAATSYIEFSIILCMAAVLGDGSNTDTAASILEKDWRIANKIKILQTRTKKSKSLDEFRRNIILVACEHLSVLNKIRNEYAHSIFEHTDDGEVRIRPFGIDGSRRNEPRILEPARVEGDIMLLDTMFRMAQFAADRISREQLQPHLDRLAAAKTEGRSQRS
jgi:hypothetical protein